MWLRSSTKIIVAGLAFGLIALVSGPAHGAVSPVSINIIPPIQFPPDDFNVAGVRASVFWGHHRNMFGLDLGLIGNITDQSFVGIGVAGGFNNTRGVTNILGLQLAGISNYNTGKTTVVGVQAALGLNVNTAESAIWGVQLALINQAPHTNVHGLQIGGFNKAQDVYGIQIGVLNMAENLHGLQIGLLNINDRGLFKFSPILNVGF